VTVDLQSRSSLGYQGIGGCSQRNDGYIARNIKLGPGYFHRPATPAFIGFTQFHADAFEPGHPSLFISQYRHGIGQHLKNHPFFFCVMHFFHTGRHFLPGPPVNNSNFRPQPQRRSCSIHGHIPPSDNRYAPAHINGCVRIGSIGPHQVAARQEFICRDNPVQVFARNAQKFGKSGARPHKNGMKPFVVHQLINCNGASHNHIAFNLNAEFADLVNFVIHHFFLGQTEFRDPVYQNASGFVQRLKNGYITTGFSQIRGTGKTCGPRPYHGYFFTIGFYCFFRRVFILSGPIGHVAFQFPDGNGFVFYAHDTSSFALGLLRADPSANSRQRRIFPDNGSSSR